MKSRGRGRRRRLGRRWLRESGGSACPSVQGRDPLRGRDFVVSVANAAARRGGGRGTVGADGGIGGGDGGWGVLAGRGARGSQNTSCSAEKEKDKKLCCA